MARIVLPVVADARVRHRVLRQEFFRTLIVWASFIMSAFAYGLLAVSDRLGMIEYSFPYVFALVHIVYGIALMSPYLVIWSSLTRTSEPMTEMNLEIDDAALLLQGSGFWCCLPVKSLRGAHMMTDALLLGTKYPMDGLVLRRPARAEEEVALFGILAQNGIVCSGAWSSSIKRTPPPLPSARGVG